MIRYLQPTDRIEEGDLFLNLEGQWEIAENVGDFVWDGEYGRYMRVEGSLVDISRYFTELLPAKVFGYEYLY